MIAWLVKETGFDVLDTSYPLHYLLSIPPEVRPISLLDYLRMDTSEINRVGQFPRITGPAFSPLQVAVREDREDDIRILLQYGADIDVTDNFGCTPLWTTLCNCISIDEVCGHKKLQARGVKTATMLLQAGMNSNSLQTEYSRMEGYWNVLVKAGHHIQSCHDPDLALQDIESLIDLLESNGVRCVNRAYTEEIIAREEVRGGNIMILPILLKGYTVLDMHKLAHYLRFHGLNEDSLSILHFLRRTRTTSYLAYYFNLEDVLRLADKEIVTLDWTGLVDGHLPLDYAMLSASALTTDRGTLLLDKLEFISGLGTRWRHRNLFLKA